MLDSAPILRAQSPNARRSTLQNRESRQPQNHKINPRNCQVGPVNVSLDRPRSSDCCAQDRQELCPVRTSDREPSHHVWNLSQGRARRAAFLHRSVSLVRNRCCRLGPPDLHGFPRRLSPESRGQDRRAPASAVAVGDVPKRSRKSMQVGR
jgi:hypothetical protein